jgi:MoaA/NifB/PqqE/SkfB family radical SAM enzyme
LNCRHCNIVEANSDLIEADLKTIEKIAINLKKVGVGIVLLTGGEPFLRKDLPDIVKIFVDNGLNPRLQTAGLKTTRDELLACYKAGARDINVSLDSIIPQKQEYINGSIPGSWQRAVECMEAINDIFVSSDRICAIETVLSKFNYMEVPALVELSTFLEWYINIGPIHITDPGNPMNFRGTDSDFKFNMPEDKEILNNLRQKLIQMKKEGHHIFSDDNFINSAFYFLENNKPNWRKNGICDSPNLYFVVLPNGDFAICCDHRLQDRINVSDESFPSIFYSKEFRQKILNTTASCFGCNYGSFAEVTLSVRNFSTFLERLSQVLFQKKHPVPKRPLKDILSFIDHLRHKYSIESMNITAKPKPGAFSQRYGNPEYKTRGAQR